MSMNDEWIQRSREAVEHFKRDNKKNLSHEDWLDYLNLHETSWILFVTIEDRVSSDFGWPGTN